MVRGSGERGTGMSGATFLHMGGISDIGNWWGPTTGGEPLALNISGALLNTDKPTANQVRPAGASWLPAWSAKLPPTVYLPGGSAGVPPSCCR
jgi:hypothetical protein